MLGDTICYKLSGDDFEIARHALDHANVRPKSTPYRVWLEQGGIRDIYSVEGANVSLDQHNSKAQVVIRAVDIGSALSAKSAIEHLAMEFFQIGVNMVEVKKEVPHAR